MEQKKKMSPYIVDVSSVFSSDNNTTIVADKIIL